MKSLMTKKENDIKQELESLQKDYNFLKEELSQFKNILAKYSSVMYYDISEYTPEDLEFVLQNNELKQYEDVRGTDNRLHTIWIKDLLKLCKDLGWKEQGLSELHTIKLFIKFLARENYKSSMSGDKRNEGDTRTNNLGSSDTVTS